MRTSFLPFSRPSISEDDISAVADVLRSGWITTGPKAAEFERDLASYTGARGAVALTSATAGLHVTLKALGIGPGDEVVTPSMTWVSTPNLISLCGATPVFVDVDRDTLMTDAGRLAAAITPRTRLIIPVHFAGAACDTEAVRRLAAERGIAVVEDAAHAIGTDLRGARVGASGTAIFSCHPIKNITSGEGGVVVSDDEGLLDRLRRLKFHGLGVDAFDRQTQGRSPQAETLEPGYKYNLPDILAVLGLRQLARVEEFIRQRTELALYYRERLAGVEGIQPLADPPYPMRHSWHLFIVRVLPEKAGLTRDGFMRELKARNIGTGLHFRAAHLQRYYAEAMPQWRGRLPGTEWNSERICSLPLFPDMTRRDVDAVVDAVRDVIRR